MTLNNVFNLDTIDLLLKDGYFKSVFGFTMFSFLPAPLLFLINIILISLNTILVATPIMLLALLKLIVPISFIKNLVDNLNQSLFTIWVYVNSFLISLTNNIKWDIENLDIKKVDKSCLIISNHISWADIVLICHIFKGNIPVTKFFLKHSLIYIPFIGLACWGLGMPFLRRYSKKELLKNPKLVTKDIDTTKKVCKDLMQGKTTLVNFCEGTRYTKEKALKANSKFKHLMPPKAASIAVLLGTIGYDLQKAFNTTLYYPDNEGSAFKDMLFGRLKRVYVDVKELKIDESMVGDYINDKKFKFDFTAKLKDIWQEKDEKLHAYLLRINKISDTKTDNLNKD